MPYAKDWTNLYGTILYSESLNRWYDVKNNRTYDYTSARHNGIIGAGRELRKSLAMANKIKSI